ncbi:MAG TPA: ABC transporter substrate-binding protein [Gaiellaceae bacterium]|jgi:polar amino acid transport system substrate-binding protein|nr:ABC transporter substrate-binding protein [Gaiellaceae bacterium]
MRIAAVTFVALAALVAGTVAHGSGARAAAAGTSCAKANLTLLDSGTLTVGTDNPAYPPWYAGGAPKGSSWKINDPNTGKGFEPAVAYAVAARLGFSHDQVKWVYVPFNRSFAPGPKSFDFDINQISYTPARAKVVSFSSSYYDVNQALVVVKGTKIAKVHSIAGLQQFKLGAQLGTTSYGFITSAIKPSQQASVFPQNAAAIQSLKNGQIDGLVVDLPTAFYVTAVQVPHSTILGQFPTASGGEHFGMVFAKGNPLVGCVDAALAKMKSSGQLQKIQQQWLAKATGAPVLK